MQWCSLSLSHVQPLADIAEHASLRVLPLVAVQLLGHTDTAEHPADQALTGGGRTLTGTALVGRSRGGGHRNLPCRTS